MTTPAKGRLRSRFVDTGKIRAHLSTPAGQGSSISFVDSTDVGVVDASAGKPHQPTASHSEEPATARPRTKPTVKRTNTTRQTKRKRAPTPELETVPLPKVTPATRPNPAGDVGREPDSGQMAETPNPLVERKRLRLSRRGTRSSARIRGKNPTDIHEPTPIESGIKQVKRKRGSLDEDNAAELARKRAKLSDDQTNVPVRANSITPSDTPPVDPVSSENGTVDHLEQPPNVVVGGGTVVGLSRDEPSKPRGFLPQLKDLRILFGLGGSGS
jgi:hypothetical protein